MCVEVDAGEDGRNKAVTASLPSPVAANPRPDRNSLSAPVRSPNRATVDQTALQNINAPDAKITDIDLSAVSD
jgi:hypothetical protein